MQRGDARAARRSFDRRRQVAPRDEALDLRRLDGVGEFARRQARRAVEQRARGRGDRDAAQEPAIRAMKRPALVTADAFAACTSSDDGHIDGILGTCCETPERERPDVADDRPLARCEHRATSSCPHRRIEPAPDEHALVQRAQDAASSTAGDRAAPDPERRELLTDDDAILAIGDERVELIWMQ